MSKLSRAAATSQTLSLVAMEEASREGRTEADLEHLLVALVLNSQIAGQVLRSLGISATSVREAYAAQHTEQLITLGVSTETPPIGEIVFHETAGYEWSTRVIEVFKRSLDKKNKGDAAAVLRELTNEPSGLISDLLERLGTSSAEVCLRLDAFGGLPEHSANHTPNEVSGSTEAFVPAPPDKVWELLANPALMPFWEPSVGEVELTDESISMSRVVGNSWVTHARLSRPDGKPLRIREKFRRQQVTLVAFDEGSRIAWLFSYPDAATSTPRRVEIAVTSAAGGTQLAIRYAWRRSSGWRRLISLPLRPVHRFLIWMHLFQVSGALSRAFR